MKADQLIKQTIAELQTREVTTEQELLDLKFDQRTGRDQQFAETKKKRKTLARIKTVIRHKQLFGDTAVKNKE